MDQKSGMNLAMERFPAVIRDLAQIVGMETAIRLVDKCGGTEVYFSMKPRPNSLAVKAIGPDAVARIAREWGEGHLTVPVAHVARLHQRNEEIRRLHASGISQQKLAREFCLTSRQIRNICNNYEDSRQTSLFDF